MGRGPALFWLPGGRSCARAADPLKRPPTTCCTPPATHKPHPAVCYASRPASPNPALLQLNAPSLPALAQPNAPSPSLQACGAQAHMVFSSVTGATREPASEFWLHGTEGTLHLDVDNGQLALALNSGGCQALGWYAEGWQRYLSLPRRWRRCSCSSGGLCTMSPVLHTAPPCACLAVSRGWAAEASGSAA